MTNKQLAWIMTGIIGMTSLATAGNLVTWPGPAGEPASTDFTLTVDGQPVFVYRARVRSLLQPREDGDLVTKRELTPGERAAFAIFDVRGPVSVEVKPQREFKTVRVLPARAGIIPTVETGVIRFRLTEAKPVTVILDGLSELPLHLFVSEPERDVPRPDDPNVRYFGPGVHEVGQLELKSGQTLYVAGGAVVKAKLPADAQPVLQQWSGLPAYPGTLVRINKAEKVRIAGRGILDETLLPRHGWTMVTVNNSCDVQISGVTLRDSAGWNVNIRSSKNVTVENLRIIGARLNSDGIDMVSSRDVAVRRCFVRSHDDGIIAKATASELPVECLTVEDCQVWDDWGYALGVTYETRAAIHDVVFRRCDVLFARHWAMGIHVSDSATVSGIRFEDIGVTTYPPSDRPAAVAHKPNYNGLTVEPKLLRCFITKDMWGHDDERGQIRDVVVENVTVDGAPLPVELLGFDAQHTVENVTLRDIRPAVPRVDVRTNAFVRHVQTAP